MLLGGMLMGLILVSWIACLIPSALCLLDHSTNSPTHQKTLHPPFNSPQPPTTPSCTPRGRRYIRAEGRGYMHSRGSLDLSQITLTHTFSFLRYYLQAPSSRRTNPPSPILGSDFLRNSLRAKHYPRPRTHAHAPTRYAPHDHRI